MLHLDDEINLFKLSLFYPLITINRAKIPFFLSLAIQLIRYILWLWYSKIVTCVCSVSNVLRTLLRGPQKCYLSGHNIVFLFLIFSIFFLLHKNILAIILRYVIILFGQFNHCSN